MKEALKRIFEASCMFIFVLQMFIEAERLQ